MDAMISPNYKRILAITLIGAGIPLIWYGWKRTHEPPDKELIRRAIAMCHEGVEEMSLRKALASVSENYRDVEGNERRDIVRLAAGAFQSSQRIMVHIRNLNIEVLSPDQALSTCDVGVTVIDASGFSQSDNTHIELDWFKEKGKWKIISARGLSPAGLE